MQETWTIPLNTPKGRFWFLYQGNDFFYPKNYFNEHQSYRKALLPNEYQYIILGRLNSFDLTAGATSEQKFVFIYKAAKTN